MNIQQMMQMMTRFQEFQKNFTGNPRQKIQELLDNGRINKEQYDQAMNVAKQLQAMFGKRC